MVKRIIITASVCISFLGLCGAYFYFVGNLAAQKKHDAECRCVNVTILDSLESSAVNVQEIYTLVSGPALGKPMEAIDLKGLEGLVRSNGEVMGAEVYTDAYCNVEVTLTQRKPVVRFDNGENDFYSDAGGYLFPVKHHIEMPVVTGHIPLQPESGFKGYPDIAQKEWVGKMVNLAEYIESSKFLKRQIQQIDIQENGDIVLYTAVGDQSILFGNCDDIAKKFAKLEAFYRSIVPEKGLDRYSVINLKVKNQIICK